MNTAGRYTRLACYESAEELFREALSKDIQNLHSLKYHEAERADTEVAGRCGASANCDGRLELDV